MRAAKAIAIYAVAVILLGALFAPVLFWFVQWTAAHVVSGSPAQWLAKQPFHRIFNRSVLIVALVGLWPLLRTLGLRSWQEVGYARTPDWPRHLALGVILGLASMAVAGALAILFGARTLDFDRPGSEIVVRMLKFLATALVVAVLEETFFRGGIQNVLQREMRLTMALVVTSAVYSALHFLKPARMALPPDAVTWTSGFDCLGMVVSRSLVAPGIAVSFITLFLAGWILGWAFAKTKALYLSIGLHGGWVLTMKTYALLTSTSGVDDRRWVGGGLLTENVATWPVLVGLFALLTWLCKHRLRPLQ